MCRFMVKGRGCFSSSLPITRKYGINASSIAHKPIVEQQILHQKFVPLPPRSLPSGAKWSIGDNDWWGLVVSYQPTTASRCGHFICNVCSGANTINIDAIEIIASMRLRLNRRIIQTPRHKIVKQAKPGYLQSSQHWGSSITLNLVSNRRSNMRIATQYRHCFHLADLVGKAPTLSWLHLARLIIPFIAQVKAWIGKAEVQSKIYSKSPRLQSTHRGKKLLPYVRYSARFNIVYIEVFRSTTESYSYATVHNYSTVAQTPVVTYHLRWMCYFVMRKQAARKQKLFGRRCRRQLKNKNTLIRKDARST